MKKIEQFLIILLVLDLLMRLINIPGNVVLLVLVLSLLSIFYFLLTFTLLNELTLKQMFSSESYSKISSLKTIGAISLGFSLSSTVVGIMFIMLYWEGGTVNLALGSIALSIIGIIALLKKRRGKDKVFYNSVLIRALIWLFAAIVVYFVIGVPVS